MLAIFLAVEDPQERDFISNLYEEDKSRLLGIAFHLLHSIQDAEDAVQENFTRLLTHSAIQKLQAMETKKREAYLTVCILNQARDILRKKESRKEVELSEELPDPKWDRQQEISEKRRELELFLAELDEKQQQILVFHFEQGMTYREIAALLGMTPAAVQKTVSRLRKKVENAGEEALR